MQRFLLKNNLLSDHYYYSANKPAYTVYPNLKDETINNHLSNRLLESAGNMLTYGKNPLTEDYSDNVVKATATTYKKDGWAIDNQQPTDYWLNNTLTTGIESYMGSVNTTVRPTFGSLLLPESQYVYKGEVTSSFNGG